MTVLLRILAVIPLILAISACSTPDHRTEDRVVTGAAVGATVGAITGALTGGIIGRAVVGAAAGAAGGLVLDQLEKNDD